MQESDPAVWSSRRLDQLTWGFVALGVFIRVFRYAMNFPLWHDEAALAANFVSRGYVGLLQPLEFFQVAPPLFLWVELTAVKVFGFSESSLRLFPLFCGVASIFLIRRVAERAFGPLTALLTVAIFAVAPHLIEHATDVKPYATDLLASLVLLDLAVAWWRDRSRSGPLWALALVSPLALGLSHPAVFVAAAVGLALAVPAWRTGLWRIRLASAAALVAPAVSFATLFVLVTRSQCDGNGLQGMRDYWTDSFPPLQNPLRLVGWLVATHTGQMFAYPEGGRRGESTGTALLCLVAIATLWQRRSWSLLALVVGPFGLTLLAAGLRRYPYGGEARIAQHLAPLICLLAGLGATVLLRALPRPRDVSRGVALTLAGLLALGIASVSRDWIKPYRGLEEQYAREFARWFWTEQGRNAELACSRKDFGVHEPKPIHFATAMYVCYREICRPRPGEGRLRLDRVTVDHPLRCVVFDRFPLTNPDVVAMSNRLSATLTLRAVESFDYSPPEGPRRMVVTVFEFAPRQSEPVPAIKARTARWTLPESRVATRSRHTH